jgi:hypothetical protein
MLRAALFRAADRELGLRVDTVDLRITDLLADLGGHNGHGNRDSADREAAGPGGREGAERTPHAERKEAGGGTQRHEPDVRSRPETEAHPPAPADDPRGTATAQAVISVPGVTRLAPVLGSALGGLPADAVTVSDSPGPDGRTAHRHVRIQLAVAEGSRALDVARNVRHAAERASAWDADEPAVPVTVAVLVSAVEPVGPGR